MLTEENKAPVLRFIAAEERVDIFLLDQLMAPDFRLHLPGSPEPMNRESTRQFFSMFHAAFPDSSRTIADQISEGELVTTRVTLSGTHRGEFQGVPPTGRRVTISGIGIHRVGEGRIAEHWPQPDLLGLMQQLGAVPTQEQAGAQSRKEESDANR